MSTIYEKDKFLGKGNYSSVYLITYNGQPAIVKELADVKYNNLALKEASILNRISKQPECHPTIVCIYDYGTVPDTDSVYIIEEYIKGQDLLTYSINNILWEEEILYVAKNLIEALVYLHEHNIVHRDIKLANVMISDENEIKLIDFGLSCFNDICPNSIVGTPNYISPELIQHFYGKDSGEILNETQLLELYKASDVWAVGILLYILANHSSPYVSKTIPSLFLEISKIDTRITSDTDFHFVNTLIEKILVVDYKQRPTAQELL